MEKSLNLPYQFDLKIIMEKEDQLSEKQRLYLRKGRSETFLHILIKILAYCYFWEEKESLIHCINKYEFEINIKHRTKITLELGYFDENDIMILDYNNPFKSQNIILN